MTDIDLLKEALKAGPLVAALGAALWVLWRKLNEKDSAIQTLTREMMQAFAANTIAINSLKDAIERGEHGEHGEHRSRPGA